MRQSRIEKRRHTVAADVGAPAAPPLIRLRATVMTGTRSLLILAARIQ